MERVRLLWRKGEGNCEAVDGCSLGRFLEECLGDKLPVEEMAEHTTLRICCQPWGQGWSLGCSLNTVGNPRLFPHAWALGTGWGDEPLHPPTSPFIFFSHEVMAGNNYWETVHLDWSTNLIIMSTQIFTYKTINTQVPKGKGQLTSSTIHCHHTVELLPNWWGTFYTKTGWLQPWFPGWLQRNESWGLLW